MKRPESEFYDATIREIFQRWDKFAECKGYKEKTVEVQEFDTEGG